MNNKNNDLYLGKFLLKYMLDKLTIQKHVKDHFRWESKAQGPIK
jgi:hypothetical protein